MMAMAVVQPLWLWLLLLSCFLHESWGFRILGPHDVMHPKKFVVCQKPSPIPSLRSAISPSEGDATLPQQPYALAQPVDATRNAKNEDGVAHSAGGWDSFDYEQHWYPVSWVCDLKPYRQPHRVTLFDVDYVVAVDEVTSTVLVALRDVCPHKAAALSQGRIITNTNSSDGSSSALLQCAYHGWSFHGVTGICQQIPQASASASTYSSRTCAQAIPAVIHQGLLWLWPGPVPPQNNVVPPSIPEMDDTTQFRVLSRSVRDFPQVDWTLLVSNILDPDHGLFAHQASAFDLYTANPEHPMVVQERFPRAGVGWRLQSSVPAEEKLLRRDRDRRVAQKRGTGTESRLSLLERAIRMINPTPITKQSSSTTNDDTQPLLLATSVFEAPTTMALFRRRVPRGSENKDDDDSGGGQVSFVTAFWVCPVGVGRSRFFSAAVARNLPSWLHIPRWFSHATLNNFLDQDTVLVASQQGPVLLAEYEHGTPRSQLFAYGSPSDRSVRRIDQFWDATVARSPNRAVGLRRFVAQSAAMSQLVSPDEYRRTVLDRKAQHLDICPDSQDAVRNLRRIRNAAALLVTTWMGWVGQQSVMATTTTTTVATTRFLARSFWPWAVLVTLAGALCEHWRRQFYFNYPAWKRDRDLRKIPSKMWSDPRF